MKIDKQWPQWPQQALESNEFAMQTIFKLTEVMYTRAVTSGSIDGYMSEAVVYIYIYIIVCTLL